MDKVVRDGKVAVLVSPDYGAGWSTWASSDVANRIVFDPDVVAWVEAGKVGPLPDIGSKYGDEENFSNKGAEDLIVCWIPIGKKFRIQEYDGYETLHLEEDYQWLTA